MANDPDAARAADLRAWRGEFPDAEPIRSVVARHRATCVGVVHKIRVVPGRQIEVTVEDGSGRLRAVFTGRTTLPGVELGSGLRLSGMVAEDTDGMALMRNPAWWHVSDPYQ